MPTLTTRFKDKILNRYSIKKEISLSIGRLGNNNIVIDNAGVSESHAQILTKGDHFCIEDLNSTNGTFVNKKQISSHVLKDGDIITIGKHELIFRISDEVDSEHIEVPKPSKEITPRGKTSSLDTVEYRKILEKNIYDPNRATLLIFRFKGKQIRKYILKHDKLLTIGRLQDNDIVIENDAMSGHHARIISKDNEFYIEDLDSTNGTFVHEKQITSQLLRDEDIITIGRHELVFCVYEKYTLEETLLTQASGLAYSTPSTTALDISEFKKKLSQGFKKNKSAFLSFVKGGQGKMLIGEKGIKIGKDPDSDIVIKGFMAGRTAAVLYGKGKDYYISCRGDFKKPKVNGKTIEDTLKLSDSDVIEIGSVKLNFNKSSDSI